MVMATCGEMLAGRMCPGQRTRAGIRRPPSSRSVFRPLNGQTSANRSPPLSLVNTTMVLLAMPAESRASRTRPTCRSISATIRANVASDPPSKSIRFLMRSDSASSPGPSQGQCGALKCRLKREGGFFGFSRPTANERHSLIPQQFGQISGLMNGHVAIPEIIGRGVCRSGLVREVIERASAKTPEVIVAALERAVVGQPAQMPLADEHGLVACSLQQGGKGRVLAGQTDIALPAARRERFFQTDRKAV